MATKAELEARRNRLQADSKILGDWGTEAQADLIEAQDLLQKAGTPNPALEDIVQKASDRVNALDEARRLSDDLASALTGIILTMRP